MYCICTGTLTRLASLKAQPRAVRDNEATPWQEVHLSRPNHPTPRTLSPILATQHHTYIPTLHPAHDHAHISSLAAPEPSRQPAAPPVAPLLPLPQATNPPTHQPNIMITDAQLYTLALFFGCAAMLMIVLYHFLEVNAVDDALTTSNEKAAIPVAVAEKN